MNSKTIRTASGFKLVELLIAMTVGLLVFAAAVGAFNLQSKIYDVQSQVTEMIQNARAAMVVMVGEIRMADYDPAGAGFDGIPYDPDRLQIVADLDGDGNPTETGEMVVYAFDPVNLQITRDAGAGPEPFAENIQSFSFEYLDATGSPTTISANIRQVRISLTARTSKPDPDYPGGYRIYTLRTLVIPENIEY